MIVVRVRREGRLVQEAVFRALPVRIGRGPESDLVLADPAVSRSHARLEQDGEGRLVLRDLGSRNGIRLGPARVETAAVDGALRCHLGGTELEVEPVSDAPTLEIAAREWRRFEKRRGPLHQLGYLLLGLTGWLGFAVLRPDFWSPWNQARVVSLLWNGLGIVIVLPMLALVLLVVLKAAGRPVRFADPLQALAGVVWLWPLAFALSYASYYALTPRVHALLRLMLTLAVLIASAIHLVSLHRPPPNRAFKLAWGLGVGLLVVGLIATGSLAQSKLGTPSVDYHVQVPVAGYPGPSRSLETYLTELTATADGAALTAAAVRARQGIPDQSPVEAPAR